jgi:hypothetical protein
MVTAQSSLQEIPWNNLAFIAVAKTLRHYFADRKSGEFPFRMGDVSPG